MKTPTYNDFVNILSDASQAHEGWGTYADGVWTPTKSVTHNNPGNLKFLGQPNASPDENNFCKFDTFWHGKQAHIADISAKLNHGYINKSLTDLFTFYLGTDANPTDVQAYVNFVIAWFRALGWTVTDGISLQQIIDQQTKPVVLIAVNEISAPAEWHLAHNSIKQFVVDAHDFCVGTRYTVHHFTSMKAYQYAPQLGMNGSYKAVDQSEAQGVLAPFNEGQEFNLVLISSIVYGSDISIGGMADELHAVSVQQPNTVYAYVLLQEDLQSLPVWTDPDSRTIFHEFIHMLFGRTGDPDILHAYLLAHGGYSTNAIGDLTVVYQQEAPRYFLMHQEVSDLEKLISFLEQLIGMKQK